MFEVGCLSVIALLVGAFGYLVMDLISGVIEEHRLIEDTSASRLCRDRLFNTWINDCLIEKRGRKK